MISPFNRTPYNRPLTMFVYGWAVLSAQADVIAKSTVEVGGRAVLRGDSGVNADFTREIFFGAKMDADSSVSLSYVRERLQKAVMHATSSIKVKGSRYHVDEIAFNGPFKPGDKIIIDSEKFRVSQNGVNAAHLYEGNFFELNLGTNNLTWTDPATGREILIRITHRDKFLF